MVSRPRPFPSRLLKHYLKPGHSSQVLQNQYSGKKNSSNLLEQLQSYYTDGDCNEILQMVVKNGSLKVTP